MSSATNPRSANGAAVDTGVASRRSRTYSINDIDLLSDLWQEAPFARLPADAPLELQELVRDIDNPRRVYAIHRASRRSNFQHLVDLYIHQLRNGCGSPRCGTPTCFTCRKRLAGKAPFRKYNSTSARTLAVYLASQDNPESSICPYLRRPDGPPLAFGNLMFASQPLSSSLASSERSHGLSSANRSRKPSSDSTRFKATSATLRPSGPQQTVAGKGADDGGREANHCPEHFWNISEWGVNQDHRSFAANLFGTTAFKMLEWLTPRGLVAVFDKATESDPDEPRGKFTATADAQVKSEQCKDACSQQAADPHAAMSFNSSTSNTEDAVSSEQAKPASSTIPTFGSRNRRNSKAGTSIPSALRDRKVSDSRVGPEDALLLAKSPNITHFPPDRITSQKKTKAAVVPRGGLPEVPNKPAFFDNVSPLASAHPVELDPPDRPVLRPGSHSGQKPKVLEAQHHRDSDRETPDGTTSDSQHDIPVANKAKFLPQGLFRLDVDIINFLCDVLEEDHTAERGWLDSSNIESALPEPLHQQRKLVRTSSSRNALSMKSWSTFNEQSVFAILMDPASLMASFAKEGMLYDSHTMWYCMSRLTRVMPSLVLHSLWIAAGALFHPPKSLPGVRSWNKKIFRTGSKQLANFEAGALLSICLHALAAIVPRAPDAGTLFEMSRIRASGQTLGGSTAKQSAAICLAYDDAFANELALRLARRLFGSIIARQTFAGFTDSNAATGDEVQTMNVFEPLLDQLDLLSDVSTRVLQFSEAERLLHETRMPTLLLDWARAVLLRDWDGRPGFLNNGSFSGALCLMEAMYDRRNELLLGDIQFRADYFSDRLDSVEMPVQWLLSPSSSPERHLLDYPFLFSPDMLVSYFRSINFARMSRMFEESSSLKTRMGAIVDPGSLITDPHHKVVLQDLLRTASSKYLVLEIGRTTALRDAFDQLWRREKRELLRPLKVHLGEDTGEEGFDSGGVQQEFFRMAIAECLDPKYGAFAVDERTRMAWFTPGSVVELWKFELVGLLVSLAIYNGLTLPVTFPRALYRKLLRKPVNQLHHIADGWPDLASGLTVLLEWNEADGLVEDIFARTYEFSVSSLGKNISRDMTKDVSPWPQANTEPRVQSAFNQSSPDDDAPLVTDQNRGDYVTDYILYLTEVSVRPQFRAFERGFRTCLDVKSLSLLSPSMLQSIVEGIQEIDISELKRCARYVGWDGDASHRTIKDFWSIVKKYDDRMKRNLLEFVTASDRVPVGGFRNLQFVIQKNGEEESGGGHLPTAYTCYGTLLLPEYRDKEALKERLGMALENAQGFGFA